MRATSHLVAARLCSSAIYVVVQEVTQEVSVHRLTYSNVLYVGHPQAIERVALGLPRPSFRDKPSARELRRARGPFLIYMQ